MAIRQYRPGGPYHAYFRDIDGKIRTISLKTTNRAVAERLERRLLAEVSEAKAEIAFMRRFPEKYQTELSKIKSVLPDASPAGVPTRKKGLRLNKMLEELEKIRPLQPTSRRIVTRFIKWCPVEYAHQVTSENALAYLEKHYGGGRNFKAFNNNKSVLNKCFRLLLVQAGMPESPFARIASRKVDGVASHRPVTDAEFLQIYYAAEEPFRTAAALGFYAGADMSTAFRLPGTAVNLQERIICWKRPKSGTKFICGIHQELYQLLEQIDFDPASDRPILDYIKKTGGTTRTVYFRRLFDRLGITGTVEGTASFHSFRASFFTRCDAANLHRRTTSLAGGHTEDRMNDLYSHDVSAAHEIEKLPPVLCV